MTVTQTTVIILQWIQSNYLLGLCVIPILISGTVLYFLYVQRQEIKKVQSSVISLEKYIDTLTHHSNQVYSRICSLETEVSNLKLKRIDPDHYNTLVSAHNVLVDKVNEMNKSVKYIWNSWQSEWQSGESWKGEPEDFCEED